jgi:hypothetical protein
LVRVSDVAALAVLAAGLSTMVRATVGTASLWLGDVVSTTQLFRLGGCGGWATPAEFCW